METKPKNIGFIAYLRKIRDPSTLAVMLEDSGACLGVVMAIIGIGLSQATANPMYDSIGGMSISILLAAMGAALARLNQRYLLGQAVEGEIVDGKHYYYYYYYYYYYLQQQQQQERLLLLLVVHALVVFIHGFFDWWVMTTGIKQMLLARPGIDNVQSVQSQWVGPYTFAYKVSWKGREGITGRRSIVTKDI